MLIWLASYPRSGNRFFRAVAHARYGLPDRTKAAPPPATDPNYRFLRTLEVLAAAPEPALVKTHDLPDADRNPAVYLLRDGRDSMVSYAHFALEVIDGLDAAAVTPKMFEAKLRELLLQQGSAYGTWGENARAWAARPGTVVVRYEDMLRDPGGEVDRALAAVGCPAPRVSDRVPTFEAMRKQSAKHVRRGVAGSWKDEFPPGLLPLFWQRNGDAMRQFGYTDGEVRAA
jgi:hypothetical protein